MAEIEEIQEESTRQKILVADDSRTSRRMLLDIIRGLEFDEIIEATDGNDAVAKFEEYQPEVVTLDITMPGMDGIEVLRAIKAKNPNVKAVMITAAAQSTKIMEAIKIGAEEFIAKPYEADQVEAALKRLI